jgi:hypothetical protein
MKKAGASLLRPCFLERQRGLDEAALVLHDPARNRADAVFVGKHHHYAAVREALTALFRSGAAKMRISAIKSASSPMLSGPPAAFHRK